MIYPTVKVNGVSVRVDSEGRYCLNDLHAAAVLNGEATESRKPSKFIRSASVSDPCREHKEHRASCSAYGTGGYTASMIASADPTYSIDGEVRLNDRSDEFGIQGLMKYFFDEVRARRQLGIWMRFHWGDYYHIG